MPPFKPLHVVVLFGLLLLYLTAYSYLRADLRGADRPECRPVYMYPSYARIKSFDESHTKYASKFSLYLYREQGIDSIPTDEKEGFKTLDGIPALFIPGNAGSYRQARSIAAEVSNLFFDPNIDVVDNPNMKNYDFFGADFNEDYTAFHGRTLVDQAEYLNSAIEFILLLYSTNPNPPTSVLILAHSMGGIVARVLPTMPNYLPGSINTIITLSSPHAAAPLTFDGDILKVYLAVDRFWHEAFDNSTSQSPNIARERLHNVSLVSITGGALDAILPADYTTLGFLVPPSNGFTVFTSGIPDVWTPMDHLAIVWCRQLRRVILKILLEIADFESPHRTYPLERRMAIMKKHLLTGFERYAKSDSLLNPPAIASEFMIKYDAPKAAETDSSWSAREGQDERFHIFHLASTPSPMLQIVTDSPFGLDANSVLSSLSLFLCRDSSKTPLSDLPLINLSSRDDASSLICTDYSRRFSLIPRSDFNTEFLLESSFDGNKSPFLALRLDAQDLDGFSHAILIKGEQEAKSFIAAHMTDYNSSVINVEDGLFSLALRGALIKIPKSRPLSITLEFEGAWSSLLAYTLSYKGIERTPQKPYQPFIRQWREWPFESKWHVNIDDSQELPVTIHAVAPFTPFDRSVGSEGVHFEFWLHAPDEDVESNREIFVEFKVNWLQSFRLLVLRYRLAIVSQCLAVSLGAFIVQIFTFKSAGKFPDFSFGLLRLCEKRIFFPLATLALVLTPLTKMTSIQLLLDMIDPVVLQDPNEINMSIHHDFNLNSFYLGLEETGLSVLGILFFIMAVSINYLVYHALSSIQNLIKGIKNIIVSFQNETVKPESLHSAFAVRKLMVATTILVLVPFYLPYQFAYVISLFTQAITTIKLLCSESLKQAWNYQMSIFIIMLWVLPISIPVLIVFVHNLNIKWSTPFSSHHNFLAVAPILIMTEIHNIFPNALPWNGDNVEGRPKTSDIQYRVTIGLLAYTIFYCIVYGIRHAFWLHHLFNFWCCWNTIMLTQALSNSSGREKIK